MIKDPNELAKAVERGDNYIEISIELGKKIIRIKATKTAATIVAIGAVSATMYAIISAPVSGPAVPVNGIVATGGAAAAVAVWGIPATVAAVSMAVAVRGTGVLKKLRKGYDVEEKEDMYVLKKK